MAFSPVSSDVVNGVLTIGLVLFMTFPANLFNSTFAENYDDIAAWWDKWSGRLFPRSWRRALSTASRRAWATVRARLGQAEGGETKLHRERAGFVAVLLIGSLFGALLDPSFGANVATVLSFVAIVVAILAGVMISALVTGGYHRARKHGKVPWGLQSMPLGLAVAAVCVLVSRGTGFTPGYLYGVICGIAFGRELARHEQAHVVALDAVVKVLLAVAAWVLWAVLTDEATKAGNFFGMVLVEDFLASLFVANLVSTVISLFPVRFLPGHQLQQWHKGAWAATFGVTLFVLVQVLLRPHSSSNGPSHAPLVTTIVLFGAFGLGSVLFHQHFARKDKAKAAAAGEGALEVGVTGATAEPGRHPGQSVPEVTN
jgi:hypothetical protein